MPIPERFALRLQRLAHQRLGRREVALVLQQQREVVDREERILVLIPERFALRLQRLAVQRLGRREVALGLQQRREVADRDEGIP